MKAIDFVKQKYPEAFPFPMIDNPRRQTSYVIIKGLRGIRATEYIVNNGARNASKAWTDARKYIEANPNEQ
jgi:hypothetical protein